jgi:hypothetical protein
MLAKLNPGNSAGLLQVANYCRDHEMPAREQEVLQRILDVAPDHAEARVRLGYVRSDGVWLKREDQLRAQGMVEYEGRWITREQMLELERIQAQAAAAAHERDKAAAEARKAEFDARSAEAQANAAQASAQQPVPVYGSAPAPYAYTYAGPYNYATPYAYAPVVTHGARCARVGGGTSPCASAAPSAPPPRPQFPINGVKDPFDYFQRPGRQH